MSPRRRVVVLSGAGVSQESGLKTFRDSGGLWEGHDVMEVASIEGWHRNPELVLDFYNQRRKQALNSKPNKAHQLIADLEKYYDVRVITQNVDGLHEAAGSSKVLHLHGKLFESRSTSDPSLVYQMDGWELNLGDTCEKGSQLRPNIVWFGEMVPAMDEAMDIARDTDIFIVVGTSLVVYPAASLIHFVDPQVPVYVIDPNLPEVHNPNLKVKYFEEQATTGMERVFEILTTDL